MPDPTSIFARAQPEIIGVPVTLRTAEIHNSEASVTSQVIEDGSPVSDHIVIQPDQVEVLAEVSNFDGNESQTIGERATTAYQELKRLQKNRELYDLLTRHEFYTDMALTNISADNTAPYNGRIVFRCLFKKVDKTQLSVVEVPESQLGTSVQKSASSKVDSGNVPPITEEDAPQQSALYQGAIGAAL